MAVGFSIKKENIRQFTDNINAIANKLDYMPVAVIKLDTALNPEAIVLDMVNQLKEFEPFGCGNPTPVFAIKGAVLDRINAVGGGKHLKLSVSRGQARLTMMKFFTTPEEFPYEAVLGKCRHIPSCDAPEGKWHLEAPVGEPLRFTISDKKDWFPETPYLPLEQELSQHTEHSRHKHRADILCVCGCLCRLFLFSRKVMAVAPPYP